MFKFIVFLIGREEVLTSFVVFENFLFNYQLPPFCKSSFGIIRIPKAGLNFPIALGNGDSGEPFLVYWSCLKKYQR